MEDDEDVMWVHHDGERSLADSCCKYHAMNFYFLHSIDFIYRPVMRFVNHFIS